MGILRLSPNLADRATFKSFARHRQDLDSELSAVWDLIERDRDVVRLGDLVHHLDQLVRHFTAAAASLEPDADGEDIGSE